MNDFDLVTVKGRDGARVAFAALDVFEIREQPKSVPPSVKIRYVRGPGLSSIDTDSVTFQEALGLVNGAKSKYLAMIWASAVQGDLAEDGLRALSRIALGNELPKIMDERLKAFKSKELPGAVEKALDDFVKKADAGKKASGKQKTS